jgi:acyl carrier protein
VAIKDEELSTEIRVIKTIAEEVGAFSSDDISPKQKFFKDLGVDSLFMAELVIELEDEFKIDIPDDVWKKVRRVEGAVKAVEAALEAKRQLPLEDVS